MDSTGPNMKKNPALTRNKPPPVRNMYLGSKQRTHLGVDRLGFHPPPPGFEGVNRLLSMSETPESAERVDSIGALKTSSQDITDCMRRWLTFMQMLKGLCHAGVQLSQSLGALAIQSSVCQVRAFHCQTMWEHLGSATAAAANVAKTQAVSSLQGVHTGVEIDFDQAEINQQVVCHGLTTLVNLQYQFSLASCDCMARIEECQCSPAHTEPDMQAVAHCFSHLPPLLQRRWSEATGGAKSKANDKGRRWSVPWKLPLPTSAANERSRSITPDAIWHTSLASHQELDDVIALLSMKSAAQGHTVPGVTVTRPADATSSRMASHRGSLWGEGEEPDPSMLGSRKSSSSTDCSSSYSLHSRASTGSDDLTHGQRTQLYSMWSGSDLPFIKLPESTETPET